MATKASRLILISVAGVVCATAALAASASAETVGKERRDQERACRHKLHGRPGIPQFGEAPGGGVDVSIQCTLRRSYHGCNEWILYSDKPVMARPTELCEEREGAPPLVFKRR